MDKLAYLIVIIVTLAFLLVAGSRYQQSAAERDYARAAMVREQSQARSDLLAAALPYVALVVVVAFGAALFAIVIVFALPYAAKRMGEPGQYIIEHHTVVILPEGAGRREMWDKIAKVKMIGSEARR